MIVTIEKDEWYPVFSLAPIEEGDEKRRTVVEVPEELYLRYIENLKEFSSIQKKLRSFYEETEQ